MRIQDESTVQFYHRLTNSTESIFLKRTGIKETTRGCCGTGELELSYLCNPLTRTCPDANDYLFWDDIHPTQRAYLVVSLSLVDQILHVLQ